MVDKAKARVCLETLCECVARLQVMNNLATSLIVAQEKRGTWVSDRMLVIIAAEILKNQDVLEKLQGFSDGLNAIREEVDDG